MVKSVCPCSALREGGRQACLGLFVGEARVGGAQLQVGHQAVELPVPGFDDHESALLHFLGRDRQPGAEGLLQTAADDVTNGFVVWIHCSSASVRFTEISCIENVLFLNKIMDLTVMNEQRSAWPY